MTAEPARAADEAASEFFCVTDAIRRVAAVLQPEFDGDAEVHEDRRPVREG
ncbi:hypothetical protein SAMN05445871_2227 [Paraburkholderia caballeronis]|uniref:Uncharacterized protein n=1 Tax=Paraburkholderia caballeronis TaxID=416943 RepID=A0A1H7K090_9BURK|nr:hypothetical protein C7403_10388 [Paraburkholderia caballeronis]PXX02656.1 hypothetical protein C7407_10388 [Paraburkholderia caballeronis]RAK03381.1 hypothetical protein C7409_10388 [Paraburkholderia caballeronis]SEC44275.1 hypothetical protein SAMN05445871_2227 [Paraburkholderia caballeronis]SEK80341.1 hypothetical protein SAMN05192542_103531 [Paraburkholderia caballeronis]